MAEIRGLKEQKQALADVRKILSEIGMINDFLKMRCESGLYEISFTLEESEEVDSSELTEAEEEAIDDAKVQESKKNKHQQKKRYAAPFFCEDNAVVRKYVLFSKREKVNRIRELCRGFNIFMDDEEESVLEMFSDEM